MPKGNLFAHLMIPVDVRFWSMVKKGSKSACWEWQGGKDRQGYGRFYPCKHRPLLAHVFAWCISNNRRPPLKKFIMHACDNPSCVNPAHLRSGTREENHADMARKWRSRSKLSARDVRAIRADGRPYRIIAADYGLKSHKSVSNIKRRLIFRHLK